MSYTTAIPPAPDAYSGFDRMTCPSGVSFGVAKAKRAGLAAIRDMARSPSLRPSAVAVPDA
jgi:hypothetical protein